MARRLAEHPDPLSLALSLADPGLLRMALRFQRARAVHLLQALELACPQRRRQACRTLAGAGANPTEGTPCAVAVAHERGWHDEAWNMQAAWLSWLGRLGSTPPHSLAQRQGEKQDQEVPTGGAPRR